MDRFDLAQQLVINAGNVVLNWFDETNTVIQKTEKDFALTADIEAEKIILDGIRNYFPHDTILSEEAGLQTNSSEYRWIVDPLDGSANFKAGIPYFCTTIALEHADQVIMSVVYDPLHEDLYFAEKGTGAFVNNQPIYVSDQNNISEFLVSYATSHHTSIEVIELGSQMFTNVLHNCRAVRLQGSSILDLCNLAQGMFDGLVKVGANYWDYAPGCLMVEEAGGIVTSIDGKPWGKETVNIIGSNSCCHQQFIESLIND